MSALFPEKKQITVVYIIGTLLVGGTEKQLVELIKGLNKTRFVPSVCCLFTRGPLEQELQKMGVDVKSFHFIGAGGQTLNLKSLIHNAISFISLIIYLKRLKARILHSNLKFNNLFGATAAKLAGVPYIIVGYRNLIDETEKYPFLSQWERKVNEFADVIVVNSEAVMQALRQRLNPDPKKIRVVYNGVDISRFAIPRPINELIIGDFSLPAPEVVITIVANLIPYKGHEDFIRAICLVYKTYPKIKCLIVGRDDGYGEYLRRLVAELNLHQVVIFVGAADNVADILAFTDIQVLASHQEGFANVILEGMAAGVPLVVTNVGGNAEAVINGETGFVVPPKNPAAMAEAILKLLTDEGQRKQMGQAGRLRAEKYFSLDRMVGATEELYQELVGSYPRM